MRERDFSRLFLNHHLAAYLSQAPEVIPIELESVEAADGAEPGGMGNGHSFLHGTVSLFSGEFTNGKEGNECQHEG